MVAGAQPSAVVRLNRAIAMGHVAGPGKVIVALEALRTVPDLRRYHLLPAALDEFYQRQGESQRARTCIRDHSLSFSLPTGSPEPGSSSAVPGGGPSGLSGQLPLSTVQLPEVMTQ